MRHITTAALLVALAAPVSAQTGTPQAGTPQAGAATSKSLSQQWGLSVFPAKGQTQAQQDKDEFDCYQWAKQNTGIDPLAPAQAAAPASSSAPQGQAVKGAAKGAAAGAAVGAIAGDAGKGAAIGATAGGMKGAAGKRKGQQQAQQQAAAQQKAVADETKVAFNKGFAACLDGKGYSVK